MPQDITTTSTVEIDDFDSWLAAPGSENIITAEDKTKESTQNNFFKTNPNVDMSFLDEVEKPVEEDEDETLSQEEKDAKQKEKENAALAVDDVLKEAEDEVTETETKKTGRPKTDKSGLVEFLHKRIESGEMVAFDDYEEGADLKEYLENLSEKDVEDLWTSNLDYIKSSVSENAPKEFFEQLPEELQHAAKYVMDGGTDIKGMFKALAQVEEVRELDPEDEDDQIHIIRSYLSATQFGDDAEIEEEIDSWKDLGTIAKKAAQFKPKLDSMQEQQVAAQIARQEGIKKQQEAASKAYADNVFEALRTGELNGLKLDKKVQAQLYTGLIKPQYQSGSGRPTNLLGHLLEKYQFIEPNYPLLAEALWLLSNPTEYKEELGKITKNTAVAEVAKKLKTEASKKAGATAQEENGNKSFRLPKQNNFFKR